jgi:hypothetical protein
MAIRLPNKAQIGAFAREKYMRGCPLSLAEHVLNEDLDEATRKFVAAILLGMVKIQKTRGRPPSRLRTLGKTLAIREDVSKHYMIHKAQIAIERTAAALHHAKLPSDTPIPILDEHGNPIRLPVPKGWRNAGGSAKERTLVSLVYPRKRDRGKSWGV